MRELNDTIVCLRAIFGFVEEHGEPDLAARFPVDAVVMVPLNKNNMVEPSAKALKVDVGAAPRRAS